MKKRIYLAGPVSNGDTLDAEARGANVTRAIDYAEVLRRGGLHVYVPHLLEAWAVRHELSHAQVMEMCFEEVRRCDALFRMTGPSAGADEEVALMESLARPVFYLVEDAIGWGCAS